MRHNTLKITMVLLTLAAFLCVGCASDNKEAQTETKASVNPEALINELIDAKVFADTVEAVDSSYIEMLMNIGDSDYSSALIYMGSGATAERVAIFKCSDSDLSNALKDKCSAHINDQIKAYADYLPAEVDKLNHSIILISDDNYVILCVASDYDKASEILDKYF